MLLAARGEMADIIPFAPRLDLWYNANSMADTLPRKHRGRTKDEIARAEGWALHKVVPEYDKPLNPEEDLHRALGLYSLKEFAFKINFSPNIDIKVNRQDGIHPCRISHPDWYGEHHDIVYRRNEKVRHVSELD